VAPQTGTALLVIAAFVLPGFVTLLLRERTYVVRGEDSPFERLLNALYYSSLIYAALALTGLILGSDTDDVSEVYRGDASYAAYFGLAAIGLFVLPLLIAEGGRRWQGSAHLRTWFLDRAGVDPGHSVPAGWEQLFGRSPGAVEGRGLLLRITLEDGRVVGGFFGRQSLAGYTAHTRDLFLEERWSLDEDDWFREPAEDSRGLWIADDQIKSIEAYAPPRVATPPTRVDGEVG
jgi:Family of unknown function (DUF6338)